CVVGARATIGPLTAVGDGCRIGSDAVVDASVLHESVSVDRAAKISQSVIGRDVRIGSACVLDDVIVGAGVGIGASNELRGGMRLWPGIDVSDGGITFSS